MESVHRGGFKCKGSYTTIDLIAAATNALNGALLARRPDHYQNFTVVGILLMALLGGLGGGITRDVLVAKIPSALTNPAYITLALVAGIIGYLLAYAGGQLFREGLFQFMTSFSLPWYAIMGAYTGVEFGLPVLGCLVLGVVGPTAGRFYIDITSGVPPKQFIRGEWFVAIAALTAFVWILVYPGGPGRLGGGGSLVRRRVHGAHDRAVPGLGGAAREGAEGRVPALGRTPLLGRSSPASHSASSGGIWARVLPKPGAAQRRPGQRVDRSSPSPKTGGTFSPEAF